MGLILTIVAIAIFLSLPRLVDGLISKKFERDYDRLMLEQKEHDALFADARELRKQNAARFVADVEKYRQISRSWDQR